MRLFSGFLAAAVLACAAPAMAQDDMPTFQVIVNDGQISTRRIEVPAKTRFRVVMVNKGKTAAEFESLPLGIELVVAPGLTRSRVLPGKSPGEYKFFDEFHMNTTQGVFIVK